MSRDFNNFGVTVKNVEITLLVFNLGCVFSLLLNYFITHFSG